MLQANGLAEIWMSWAEGPISVLCDAMSKWIIKLTKSSIAQGLI